MSRIGDLRANEENNLNLVKVLEVFSGGETKYVEMLLKLYKTIGDTTEIKVNTISARTGIDPEKIKVLSENEIDYLYYMCDNTIFLNYIKYFAKFREYNEQNLIENKDLHSYKTFDQVVDKVKVAHEKVTQKELEKSIEKIHEDNDWLILIPLTYEASVKYGYNTKWCTASDTTAEQYKSYTRDGVLIYIIQKNKSKTAAYKRIDKGEISFWDQKDNRIDSIQCNFPSNIMEIVTEKLRKTNKPVHDPKDFVKSSQTLLEQYNTGIGIGGIMGVSGTSGFCITGSTNGRDYTQMSGSTYSFGVDPALNDTEKEISMFDDRMKVKAKYLSDMLSDTKKIYQDSVEKSWDKEVGSINETDYKIQRNPPAIPTPNFNDLVQNQGYLDRVKSLMRKLS